MINPLFGKKIPSTPSPKLSAKEIERQQFLKEKAAWEAKGGKVEFVQKGLHEEIKWTMNGKYDRAGDLPAYDSGDGHFEWYKNGKQHRANGPAIVYPNGTKEWWYKGLLHRLDGPAVEQANGRKVWWVKGQKHRTDGPAVITADGFEEYWENGEYIQTRGSAI